MTLGQRIQKHRLRLELSQEVLGEKLGVSRQAVSKWEADAAVPDTDKLIALSKLFGLTLNQLLQVEEPQAEVSETASPPEREKGAGETRRECGLQRVLPVLALTAVLLGMAALALSFWRTAGKLSDRIALLEQQVSLMETSGSALDPADLIGDWELDLGERREAYTLDGVLCRDVLVTVALSRHDPEQELEVYFQVYGGGVTAREVAAQPAGTGVYSAQVPVPQGVGPTVAVGFRIQGVEYLQPLAEISGMRDSSLRWSSLLPE